MMASSRALLCLLVGAGLSCAPSGGTPTERERPLEPASATALRGKPTAPVDVRISAQRSGAGEYRITLVGTPTTDVGYVALELLLPSGVAARGAPTRARFDATTRGTPRTLTATVRARGPGAYVRASVRVGVAPGYEPNRMAEVVLGKPRTSTAPPPHTVVLPSGERLDEVGP